jgi:hypothetical protein
VHGASVAAPSPSPSSSLSASASPCDLSGVWVAVGREDDGSAVRVRGAGARRLTIKIDYRFVLAPLPSFDSSTHAEIISAGAGGDHGIAKPWRGGGSSAVSDELFDGAVRSTHARIPCRSWWSWWWALTVPSAVRWGAAPPPPTTINCVGEHSDLRR